MITCPNCERSNEDNAKICAYCGEPLDMIERVATRALDNTDYEEGRPMWGAVRFDANTYLTLTERETGTQINYAFDSVPELVLGRTDPETGKAPQIDLEPYGASEKGVSRRHAVITWRDNKLQLVDMESPNGTFINGQRIASNEPRLLRDGDELRLGRLILRLTFSRA